MYCHVLTWNPNILTIFIGAVEIQWRKTRDSRCQYQDIWLDPSEWSSRWVKQSLVWRVWILILLGYFIICEFTKVKVNEVKGYFPNAFYVPWSLVSYQAIPRPKLSSRTVAQTAFMRPSTMVFPWWASPCLVINLTTWLIWRQRELQLQQTSTSWRLRTWEMQSMLLSMINRKFLHLHCLWCLKRWWLLCWCLNCNCHLCHINPCFPPPIYPFIGTRRTPCTCLVSTMTDQWTPGMRRYSG